MSDSALLFTIYSQQWLNALKQSDVSKLLSLLQEFSSEKFSSPSKRIIRDECDERYGDPKSPEKSNAAHDYHASVSISGEQIDCFDVAIQSNSGKIFYQSPLPLINIVIMFTVPIL